MAINFNNGVGPTQNGTSNTRERDNVTPMGRNVSSGTDSQAAEESTDSVQLSSQVQSLQSLEAKIKDMPDVDEAKVERIKSAIANGEYEINYERLAAAIQRFESGA
ncbi:flagellar biosynthesis anti-sigma factor FlgM [Natronospirillum operosum]|uniref:Negative regulator of flagellin synthesis n=1 Tax=Natronospirillum operosum TaxID=2759953 RepID=A0A4Z0WDU7_9GAMM|nr:flagellar biosynthesis anti-sigma factor FlgM [Natronospirillum operosum]TGG96004.1 flagellar biosynthesis anti-sigma factor FlgM [Natronospirillum operosum]